MYISNNNNNNNNNNNTLPIYVAAYTLSSGADLGGVKAAPIIRLGPTIHAAQRGGGRIAPRLLRILQPSTWPKKQKILADWKKANQLPDGPKFRR